MIQRTSGSDTPLWLGQEHGDRNPVSLVQESGGQKAERHEAFGGSKLWIGQHTADQDVLVFDPAEADPCADVLALYSLTQHRMRSFPRATVLQQIHVLTDEIARARAKKDYSRRATLRAVHEQAVDAARTERMDRQRNEVIAAHRRHLETLGHRYEGVHETPAGHRSGRRTRCHECGIALDDFAGTVCGICDGVLCSCGACACGKPK